MTIAIVVILSVQLIVNILIMFMVASIVSNEKETREAYSKLQTEKLKKWQSQMIKQCKKN